MMTDGHFYSKLPKPPFLSCLTNFNLLYKNKILDNRLEIPLVACVACTLLKLAHVTSMQLCSELFAISTLTFFSVIHNTCCAINIGLRHEIAKPTGIGLL